MYRKHCGLSGHPFSPEIAPDDLFLSGPARELDVRLTHLLDLRGIGLITGDSGSGKPCACRRVLSRLHPGLSRVIYVSLSTGNVMDLDKTISACSCSARPSSAAASPWRSTKPSRSESSSAIT